MADADSNSPSFCRHRLTFKSPADVVRCWLKTISTSGRVEHYMLSRNCPEIHALSTTPSRQVDDGSVSRPESSDSILSALSTFHVAPLSDYDHLRGFQYLNTNSHVRNISFLTLKSTFVSLLMAQKISSLQNMTCKCC